MSYKEYEDQRSIIALHKAVNDFNAGVFFTAIPAALEAKVSAFKSEQAQGTELGETLDDLQEKGGLLDLSELADPSEHVRAWKRPVGEWDLHDKLEAFSVYLSSNELFQQINNGYHGVHENRSVWDFNGNQNQYVPLSKGYNTQNLLDTFKEYGIDLSQIDHNNNIMLHDLIDHKIKANLISHEEMLDLRKQDRYLGLKKLPEDAGIEFPEFEFEYIDNTLTIKPEVYSRLTQDTNEFQPEKEGVSDSEVMRRVNERLKIEMENRKQLKEALMQRDEDIAAGKVDLEALAAEEAEKEAAKDNLDNENDDPEKDDPEKDDPEKDEDGLTDKEREEDLAEIEKGNKDHSAENAALAPCNNPNYGKSASKPRDNSGIDDPEEEDEKDKDKDKDKDEPYNGKKAMGAAKYSSGEIPSKKDTVEQGATENTVPTQHAGQAQQTIYSPFHGFSGGVRNLFGFGNKQPQPMAPQMPAQPMPTMTEMAFEAKDLSEDLKTASGERLDSAIDMMNSIHNSITRAAHYKFDKTDNPLVQKDLKHSKELMKQIEQNLKEVANNKDATDEQKKKAEELRNNIEGLLEAIEDIFKMIASKFSRDSSPSPS